MKNSKFIPEILDSEIYFVIYGPYGSLKYDSQLSPLEYLDFARTDLSEGVGHRSSINAFGNAKRALHLQVDTICEGYGYKSLRRSSHFPPKLEFLQSLGLVTPRILNKLNSVRNKVEHDYSLVNESDAKLFCDVVELFYYATEGYINFFPDETHFSCEDCGEAAAEEFEETFGFEPWDLEFHLEPSSGIILIYDLPDPQSYYRAKRVLQRTVNIKDAEDEYYRWLKKTSRHVFRRF